MTMSQDTSTVRNIRRRTHLVLPSRRKHAALALLTFTVLGISPALFTHFFGDANDARSFGSVSIAPPQAISPIATLNDERLSTPDILAGEIAVGENPTDALLNEGTPTLDALGNPIKTEDSAANTTSPSTTPTPKTILIDGNAIGPSRLAPAPFAGLTRKSQYGTVPVKGPNGKTPLNSYNRPFAGKADKKPVSIIIGGLGVNRSVTQQAIDTLPPDITLSFAAHTTGLQGWIDRAREAGHEVMIEIPMDTAEFNANEPGADRALLTSQATTDNLKNMDWLLSRAQGYFGVINYNGDTFLIRADMTAPILGKLSDSGLGFITDGAFAAPSLDALSAAIDLPYKNSFGLIDPEPNTQIIQTHLDQLTASALSGTEPIGVGFAYPETINIVASWVADLNNQGLTLAPASHTLVK